MFDLVHAGHVEYLERARALGDRLVVSVTADEYVTKRKPIFSATERIRLLQAFRFVDSAILSAAPTAVQVIQDVRPDLYVKGIDYQANDGPELQWEREAVESCGGQLVFLATPKFSSTEVIRRIRELH